MFVSLPFCFQIHERKYCEFVYIASSVVSAHYNSPIRIKVCLVPSLVHKKEVLELNPCQLLQRGSGWCLYCNICILGLCNEVYSEQERPFHKLIFFQYMKTISVSSLPGSPCNFADLKRRTASFLAGGSTCKVFPITAFLERGK